MVSKTPFVLFILWCLFGGLLWWGNGEQEDLSLEAFNGAINEQVLSITKSDFHLKEDHFQSIRFNAAGELSFNSSFHLPVLFVEPKSDTIFFVGEEPFAAVLSGEHWVVIDLVPWVKQDWVFFGEPRFKESAFPNLALDFPPKISKVNLVVLTLFWLAFLVLGIVLWSQMQLRWSYKVAWLPFVVFLLAFKTLLPDVFQSYSVFSSALTYGPWLFQNGLEVLFWSVIYFVLFWKKEVQKDVYLPLQLFRLVFLVFIVRSAVLDTQFNWNFSQPQELLLEQWMYLLGFGFFSLPLKKPAVPTKTLGLCLCILVLIGIVYFVISPDWILIGIIAGLLITVHYKSGFLSWTLATIFLCGLLGYSFQKFQWKKNKAYAKRSLFEGYTISDYDLEEQLVIYPFSDTTNWKEHIQKELGFKYTLKSEGCSNLKSGQSKNWENTEISFLQKEVSPFLIPDYRVVLDSSCFTLKPNRGGLNNTLWSSPLLDKHIYLYEKNGCWLDGKSGESCKSLADWEKKGYYMYPHQIGDQGLAVLIPKYTWADWLGVFVVFVSLILVFQGVAMFFRFRKRLLASYISKFTVFQVGGILVLVAGLLVFIQFGIIRFGESQFEALKVEKTESVLLELQSKFRNGLNGDEVLFAALQKFAYVFQTELVLYRPNGKFWMASFYPNVQSNIGFQIPTVHLPELPSFQGGNVRFSSSLSEVFGAWKLQDQPIGYLGVPYSKAGLRVSKGVSEMQVLVSGGVLFLVLGLVGLLLWVVRNRIEPIEQLRRQLEGWEQGKGAQILQYQREDEFGVLVKAFNRATRLLSIREKEGAWKGVAQQIAHEIKNPLTPLRLQLQLLPRKLKNLSEKESGIVEEFVKNTLVQIDAMADMAENFSTFARLPQPKHESMTVWESMESAVETFKSQVVFEVDQAAFAAIPVFWDKAQWIRIWTNLFKNALQAAEEDDALIRIELIKQSNGFRILVSDNGIGIDPAIIPSIFEPNFTTKSGGTGLGLAMVKRMVELHHGQIGLLKSTQSGTSFFLDFQ